MAPLTVSVLGVAEIFSSPGSPTNGYQDSMDIPCLSFPRAVPLCQEVASSHILLSSTLTIFLCQLPAQAANSHQRTRDTRPRPSRTPWSPVSGPTSAASTLLS